MVDKIGKGTRWMVTGAILSLIAHLLLAFAPAGVPLYGYLSMVFLGFGYSLVPAAMWPSVPKLVPAKVLGTAYSLIYWVQNLGLMLFKMLAGNIFAASSATSASAAAGDAASTSASAELAAAAGAVRVEIMFVIVCVIALFLALGLRRSSARRPELHLDSPSKK